MGLQRTPPPGRDTHTTNQDAGPSQPGNTSLPSPSQAFAPRNPRVMRSPQSGSTLGSSTSSRPIAPTAPAPTPAPGSSRQTPATPAPQYLAPVDEGNVSTTPSYAPPSPAPASAPAPMRAASPTPVETLPIAPMSYETELSRPEPITPANKRRKSRHHADPPPPMPDPVVEGNMDSSTGLGGSNGFDRNEASAGQSGQSEVYGKRYQAMMGTLELAVKNSSKMT
jgi:hypothetical protein